MAVARVVVVRATRADQELKDLKMEKQQMEAHHKDGKGKYLWTQDKNFKDLITLNLRTT